MDMRVSKDEESMWAVVTILGNENIFAAQKQMFIEQNQYLNVDVHLDKKIWRMWKITGENERLRSCVFFFGKSCTYDYSSC